MENINCDNCGVDMTSNYEDVGSYCQECDRCLCNDCAEWFCIKGMGVCKDCYKENLAYESNP